MKNEQTENLDNETHDAPSPENTEDMIDVDKISPLTQKELSSACTPDQLNHLLENIKTLALSPDGDTYDQAWDMFVSVLGLKIDLTKMTIPLLDSVIQARTRLLPDLQNTHQVLSLGGDIQNLLDKESNLNSFSIGNIADNAKSLYNNKIINDEQMARAYYSIGQLYFQYKANNAYDNNLSITSKHIDSYTLKALSLTSDIAMINACINNISETSRVKRNEFALEACERALKKSHNKDRDTRFQIYSLCGKCYYEKASSMSIGYRKNDDAYKCAAIYYQAALRYSQNNDDKRKTLRNLSNAQKNFDMEAYIGTRMTLLSFLEGKNKVCEALKIASTESIAPKNKEKALKIAANELIDSSILPDEKMHLWQNIKRELISVYGDNQLKLSELNNIDAKCFKHKTKSTPPRVNISSSKGSNYFGG